MVDLEANKLGCSFPQIDVVIEVEALVVFLFKVKKKVQSLIKEDGKERFAMIVESEETPEFYEVAETNHVDGKCFVFIKKNKSSDNNNFIDFICDSGATKHTVINLC